jgi:hypothetical protein
MRFVLVKGSSQYGSLRLHADQLAAALVALNHEAVVIDLTASESLVPLIQAMSTPTDCLFAFNGVACEFAAQDFVRDMGCVYACLYVDHPVHHLARLEHPINKQVLFFLDRSHVQFVANWGAGRNYAHLGFLPPGANTLDAPVDVSDEAFAARDIPLLFTGTFRGAPPRAWEPWPDSPARSIVAETAERMAADGRLALLDALRAVLAARNARLSPDLMAGLAPLLPSAQQFAEAYHRNAVLTALGEAGAPLEVHGNGWEALAARYPSIRHAGEGSFTETLGIARRARIVLNINNGFVAGGHERVFTAMSAGAAVVSEASRYYEGAFKDGREIATFAINRPADVVTKLAGLMADVPAQAALARAGHKRALAEHSWTARAATLVKAVQAAR